MDTTQIWRYRPEAFFTTPPFPPRSPPPTDSPHSATCTCVVLLMRGQVPGVGTYGIHCDGA